MKKLIVIALCLFSMFVVYATTVHAVQCGPEDGSKIIDLKAVKKCDGVSDGNEHNVFNYALKINGIAGVIFGCLSLYGIYKICTKTEMAKKEKTIAVIFAFSPVLPFIFFFIIKWMQNLM